MSGSRLQIAVPPSAPEPSSPAPAGRITATPRHDTVFSRESYVPGTEVEARILVPERKPNGEPKLRRNGKPVLTREPQPAVIEGHDVNGRAVVRTASGTEFHVNWTDLSPLPGPAKPPRPAAARDGLLFEGLGEGAFQLASKQLKGAAELGLERPVIANRTVGDFVDALREEGHEVLLVGGAIRDSVHDLAKDPETPLEKLVERYADTDIVTTAAPAEIRALTEKLLPDSVREAIWTPPSIDRFGVVGIGPRKSGLDVATLRVGIAGRKGAIFGKRLVDDASARDFSVNQLYLDVDEALLIDTTEHGVHDAERKLLRVNEHEFLSNDLLSLRYLKFRARGFTGTEETRSLMKTHAEKCWPALRAEGNRFASSVLRIVPGDTKTRSDLERYLGKLRTVMAEDGMEALFEQYIEPALPEMASLLSARQSKQ